ncbi:MAG: RIP metalloprotease RseP [Epsilonproteobacteria bacterium]|nr:RIP metalloprotease RseP [Campylobacterota bacterium]
MSFISSLIVLSFLIFFHELGHFLVARFFGVQVDVFSIGFGKKIFSKQIGKTQWSISMIPLGGYVKMKGQDDTDPLAISSDSDSYNSKKPWQRILILLGGPFANILTAFFVYITIAFIGVPTLLPTVGELNSTLPAYEAGLKKGDKILEINHQTITKWEDIGVVVTQSSSPILNIRVQRGNENIAIVVTPKIIESKNIFGESISKKVIGIAPKGDVVDVHYGFVGTIEYAFDETIEATTMIVKGIEKLITGVVAPDQISGVIGIVDITSQASSMGIVTLLFFTALISVNLGVANLLPIPALDGGHIMFNLYEMIISKAPSETVLYKLTVVGWAMLFGLMFLGLYNDINRLFLK